MNGQSFVVISIEGQDGVGKATQSELLRKHLIDRGLKTVRVEVPIKSLLTHKLIYFMLRRGIALRFPRLFHLIQLINKLWWQTYNLSLISLTHDVLILDRWDGSYWVYGLESGLSPREALMVYGPEMLLRPDHTFVLTGERVAQEKRDEYEKDSSLQDRVRSRFVEWANSDKNRRSLIDANRDIDVVHRDIISVLSKCRLITEGIDVEKS
jgi:thymidylate kinase